MLELMVEGKVVKTKRFKTSNGADGISFKLEVETGQGKYRRTQQCTAFGAERIAALGAVQEGRVVKVRGLPKAKAMIGDDGAPFAWIELTGCRLASTSSHSQNDPSDYGSSTDDIPF